MPNKYLGIIERTFSRERNATHVELSSPGFNPGGEGFFSMTSSFLVMLRDITRHCMAKKQKRGRVR
jgi:hypothetical protein